MKKIRVLSIILAIVLLMTSVRMDWWERADALTDQEYSAVTQEFAESEEITLDASAADADQSAVEIAETEQGSDQESDAADSTLTIEEAATEEITTDAETNRQEESAEAQDSSQSDGEAAASASTSENTEVSSSQDGETPSSADSEAASEEKEAALTWQTLTVEAETAELQDEWNNPTEPVTWMNNLWQWLFARDAEVETFADSKWKLFGRNKSAPVTLTISGYLPEGVTAEASYIQFAEPDIYSETALLDFDLALYDAEGNPYIPQTNQPFTIQVDGKIINEAAEAEKNFLVYAQTEDTRKEEDLPKDEFTASMLVYRASIDEEAFRNYQTAYAADEKANVLFSEVRYTDIVQQKNDEPVQFTKEDEKKGTLTTQKDDKTKEQSVIIEAGTLPLRFVLSAQQAERSLEGKTDDGQTEVSVQGALSEKMTVEAEIVEIAGDATASDAENTAKNADNNAGIAAENTADNMAESALENVTHGELVGAWDISLNHEEEGACQPDSPVKVTITDGSIGTAMEEGTDLCIWSISEEGEAVLVEDAEFYDHSVAFETKNLATFAVTYTMESYYKDCEGQTWKITATYGSDTGIPADAELKVCELEDSEYENYIKQTAEALQKTPESVKIAKAFDITFEKEGMVYHNMNGDVQVTIQLLDQEPLNAPKIVHFGQNTEVITPQKGEGKNGTELSFASDSFSIYVITDEEEADPSRIYLFMDDNGYVYNRQQVFEGGWVTTPANPVVEGRIFKGWYMTHEKGGVGEEDTWEDPFEPFQVTDIPQDSTGEKAEVYSVYGRFDDKIYISFYEQDGTTIEKLLTMDMGQDVYMNEVSYTPVPVGTTFFKFLGWSDVKNPTDDETPEGNFRAMEDRSFYPILQAGHYVYFNTNATGSGTTYIEPGFVPGTQRPSAPAKPERAGWEFQGWYDAATGGNQVFDTDGSLVVNTYDNGLKENLNLYAHWKALPTKMTVVWWVQNSTDAAGLENNQKSYQFLKTQEFTQASYADGTVGPILSGTGVKTVGGYWIDPANHMTEEDPNGFVYNEEHSDSDYVPVEGDGSTTFNIYFDRKTYHLIFVDHDFTKPNAATLTKQSALKQEPWLARIDALYGADITGYWPLEKYAKIDGVTTTIGTGWSWRADSVNPETVSPDSLTSAFKAIPVMPIANGSVDENTVYFAHNTAVGSGQSHSYVELHPDVSPSYAQEHVDDEVEGLPGVKKYVYLNGTWYEHRLTQQHGFVSGNEINSTTHITRGAYFFDLKGFKQGSTSVTYRAWPYNSKTYGESTDDSSVPYVHSVNKDIYSGDIGNMFHYYTRNSSDLRVMLKWGDDNAIELKRQSLKFEKRISREYLEDILNTYLETHPIPNGMEFTGWYLDDKLTNKITDLDNLSMPADNLSIYAGIEYKWYIVNIDPNGGVIDQEKNETTWLWRRDGSDLSEYSISRDYVLREGGEYSYVYYTRNPSDSTRPRTAYYTNGTTPTADAYTQVTPGYAYEKDAYILLGWYELDHVESDGTKVLKDKPYAFGSEIHNSMTLVAKWRRNATYYVKYAADAVDESGTTYAITPPVDNETYAEFAGAVVKAPVAVPDGMRLKYWKVMVGDEEKARLNANESISILDDYGVVVSEPDEPVVEHINLVAVLEDNPSGNHGGTASDVRSYWFFTGRPEDTDDHAVRTYYNEIQTRYDPTDEADKAELSKQAYYVQNISPGEELVVPTPPEDPSGQGRPFLGWYTDPELNNRFNAFGVVGSPVHTRLYASFDPGYTVTYMDKKDGIIGQQIYSKSGSAKLVTYGVLYTPDDGSMMYGWTDKQINLLSDVKYAYNSTEAQSLVVNRDITLYPVSGKKQFLYFDSNGGSYVDPVVLPIDRRPEAPASEPGRPGYLFQGWFTEKEGGERYQFGKLKGGKIVQLPEEVTKLYAHWERQSHTTVDSSYKVLWWVQQDNGSYAYSNEMTVSNAVFVADHVSAATYTNLPENPNFATAIPGDDRYYYELDHATDDKGNDVTSSYMVVEDHGSELNIYLKKTHDGTLHFDANGGAFAGGVSSAAINGIALGDDLAQQWPDAPTKEGFQFTGWNTAADGKGDSYSAGKATGSMLKAGTLYAQWTSEAQPSSTNKSELTYKVKATYQLKDGDKTREIVEYTDISYEQYIQLKTNNYAADNFLAWKKNIGGYSADASWFRKDGDTTGDDVTEITRYSYTYDWLNTGTTYYFYQNRNWYYLQFNKKGSGFKDFTFNRHLTSTSSVTSFSGENVTLYSTTNTNSNYRLCTYNELFSGFSEGVSGNNGHIKQTANAITKTTYYPGVISITLFYTKEVKTQDDTYNLTFKDLEGGNATVSQVHSAGDAISGIPISERPEYKTFLHWSLTPAGEAYTFGAMPEQNVTLYAVWKADPVTVKTHIKHALIDRTDSYSGSKGEPLGSFEIPEPEQYLHEFKYYIFDHWSLTSDGEKLPLSTIITEDTDIYAVFREKPAERTVNVYYDLNGGTLSGSVEGMTRIYDGEHSGRYKDNTDWLAGGSALVKAANLTKTEYTDGKQRSYRMVYWTENADGSGTRYYPLENIPLGLHDVVLYAQYSNYRETRLTYDLNQKGGYEAKFYEAGNDYVRTDDELNPQQVEIRFKDFLDLTEGDKAQEPNTPYTVGTMQDGSRFTVFWSGHRFKGWSTDPNTDPADAARIIAPGTQVRVNTQDAANNILYAVWEEVKLPVQVWEVSYGVYDEAVKKEIGAGKDPFLTTLYAAERNKAETSLHTANSWYNAYERNAVPDTDDFGKAVLSGDESTVVTFVRFDTASNAWQYSTDDTDSAEAAVNWLPFGDNELKLYYFPREFVPKVYWVYCDSDGGLTELQEYNSMPDAPYYFIKSNPTPVSSTFNWRTGVAAGEQTNLFENETLSKNTALTDAELFGVAMGPMDTMADQLSALTFPAERIYRPMYMRNTVDGVVYADSEINLAAAVPHVGQFAIYAVYKRAINHNAVCKITDKDGNLLYYKDGTLYKEAVFTKLEDAFAKIDALYTSETGGTAYTATTGINIEMLKDSYTPDAKTMTINKAAKITLTTAGRDAEDGYPFAGLSDQTMIQAGDTGTYRMFELSNASVDFTVKDITLDGNSENGRTANETGGLFYVSANGAKLTLAGNAVLQNSITSYASGGAIRISGANCILTMTDDAIIQNCQSNTHGGGVYSNGKIVLSGSSSITGNTINSTDQSNGAGIYMAGGEISVGGSVTIYDNNTKGTTETVEDDTYDIPGDPSNLRLRGTANTSYITLTESLTGKIGICNAGNEGYQFGTGSAAGLTGQENFTDDINGMYGALDSGKDKNGTKIYWKLDPICQVVIRKNGVDTVLGQYSKWDAGVTAANNAGVSDDGIVHLQLLKDIGWSGTFQRINPRNNDSIVIESAPEKNERFTLQANGARISNKLFVWNKNTLFTNIILDGGSELGESYKADLWRIGYVEGINTVTVTLGKDCIVQNATANSNGGAFCVYGTLAMEDNAIIQNCRSGDRGGAVHLHGGVTKFACKDNAIIQNCYGRMGGAIYSESSDKDGITVSDNCKIINNSTANSGGAFFTDKSGVHITVSGNAEVSGNHADKNGGAFFASAANVVITITENAKMENNTTGQSGAAVFASGNDTSIVIGGNALIQNNVSEDGEQPNTTAGRKAKGGGAIFNLDAAVEVSGSPTVRHNTTNVDGNMEERNVVVPKEMDHGNVVTHLTVTAPLTGGEIGIYCADEMDHTGRTIVSEGTYHVLEQFGITVNPLALNVPGLNRLTNDRSENALSGVSGIGTGTRLVGVPATGNKVVWYYVCQIIKDGQFKKVYGSIEAAASEVNNFGDGDLKIEMLIPAYQTFAQATINKNDDATVTLTTQKGSTVAEGSKTDPSDFYNSATGYSYLDFNSQGRPAKVYRGYDGGSVLNLTKGGLTVTDIILDGHSAVINGNDSDTYSANTNGGLISAGAGTVTIGADATLRNSTTSENGGAIFAYGSSDVTMTAGLIDNCHASSSAYRYGGGICHISSGTLTMSGGKIQNCTSSAGEGGGISQRGGELRVNGSADIYNCSASYGGGIHIIDSNSKIAGNAQIRNCTATGLGGGIYIYGTYNDNEAVTTEVSGDAKITSCSATGNGGGINVGFRGKLEVSGNAEIKDCSAANGGAIHIENTFHNQACTGKISGAATIDHGTATGKGGAVYVDYADGENTPSSFTFAGGTVRNSSSSNGGAVDVGGEKVRLFFEGTPKIIANTDVGGNKKNVVLEYDYNDIIQVTTNGLQTGAEIGVYVPGNHAEEERPLSQYDKHGVLSAPFGTWADNSKLSSFTNDRNGLVGTSYTDIDENDKQIYWLGGTSYIKLKNETDKTLYAKVIINDGVYHEELRKRGSGEQSAVKATKGADNKYYYLFGIGPKATGVSESETLFLPTTADATFRIELYEDSAMTARVTNLLDLGIADDSAANVKQFNDDTDSYSGNLTAGPRYKVKVTKDDVSSYITIPQKLDSKIYTYDKDDPDNCYNEAEKAGNFTYIHIVSAGQQVAFMKLDGFGANSASQNGAVFTLYTDLNCTKAYTKKVNGTDAPVTAEAKKQGSTVNSTAGTYESIVLFEKIPAGIYYMKETTKPAGYTNDATYAVIVGKDYMDVAKLKAANTTVFAGVTQTALDAQNNAQGSDNKKTYAIFKITDGKADANTDIVNYGLMNTSTTQKKVILKKVAQDYTPLPGAVFTMYNYDMSVREKDIPASIDNGLFWIGDLPLGTYYLQETTTPTDYESNQNKYFKLEVTADGTNVSVSMDHPDVSKKVVETIH